MFSVIRVSVEFILAQFHSGTGNVRKNLLKYYNSAITIN